MSAPNRIDIDEKLKGDAIICKQGVDTAFWELIKSMFKQLSDAAKDALVVVDPKDVSTISQLQSTVKAVDQLINVVEDTARLI